jgi:hypothetical protein
MDKKNDLPKTEKDFKMLNDLCMSIVNEESHIDRERDWTEDEIDLFVQQFQDTTDEDEEPLLDMEKLDPKFYPKSYFREKFSGFDESVIDILYECENKKLEDARLPPLRVKVGNFPLNFENEEENKSLCKVNGEAEEDKPEASSDADCPDSSPRSQEGEAEEAAEA